MAGKFIMGFLAISTFDCERRTMSEKERTRVKVSSPLAEVRVARVNVNGASVTHQGIEILNDAGKWECLSIHSASYNLISNTKVNEITQHILNESFISWRPQKEVWTGRYWAKLFMSDVAVDAPRIGDTLSLGLRVENSYDGSCQFRMVLMGYVLSCTNGLVSPKHFSSYTLKHIGSEDLRLSEILAHLDNGVKEVENLLPRVNRLSQIPLTTDLICRVANETNLPNGEWGHINKLLGGAETAWDLMQCITHRLSHNGRGRAGLLNEEEIGDYFLDKICDRAA
jgi:hypothetical protein